MRISVFGLGYVGAVTAGCLAKDGHTVVGVDPQTPKVDLINAGETPVIEEEIGDIIAAATRGGRLVATTEPEAAVIDSEISLICVGTPSQLNGNLDLSHVPRVGTVWPWYRSSHRRRATASPRGMIRSLPISRTSLLDL